MSTCSYRDFAQTACTGEAQFAVVVATELINDPFYVCRAHAWEALRSLVAPSEEGFHVNVSYLGSGGLRPNVDFEWETE